MSSAATPEHGYTVKASLLVDFRLKTQDMPTDEGGRPLGVYSQFKVAVAKIIAKVKLGDVKATKYDGAKHSYKRNVRAVANSFLDCISGDCRGALLSDCRGAL